MGTWDLGPFDNDDAADWTLGFADADREAGIALLTSALSDASSTPPESWLDSTKGCRAVAAAEVVAAIGGLPVEETPYAENVQAWLVSARPVGEAALYGQAVGALERVLGPKSEVLALWDAEPSGPTFRRAVSDRIASLRSLGAGQ